MVATPEAEQRITVELDGPVTTDVSNIAVHDLGGHGPTALFAHATGFHAHCWTAVTAHLPTLHSVAYNVEHCVRVAGAVRDRLSTDNWRVLNRLSEMLGRRRLRQPGLAEALELLDQVILLLVAVGGLEMAHMTRDDGWRFMSMGRHLERLLYVTTSVAQVSASEMTDNPALLEWLLDVSDSIITYRARYMGRAEWLAVVDLLLFDARNPRSAVFQIGKLSKHVPLLPAADLGVLVPTMERLFHWRTTEPASGDLFPGGDTGGDTVTDFLERSEQVALRLSDALTLRYFSHVYEPSHATSVS